MFRISQLNPKDKTLDEIHQIQKQIYENDRGLIPKEVAEKFNDSVRELTKNTASRL